MSDQPEFKPWPKITRKNRAVVVSEKIDGTNALVCVTESGDVLAGSRTRWITPADDNYGFARWVYDNADSLRVLGPGYHYGEWAGRGIQRGYGLSDRRFYLFNSGRWNNDETRPACCHVVPVLGTGFEKDGIVDRCVEDLRVNGSRVTPGFPAEGVVVYHTASGLMQKITLVGDEKPKGSAE